LKGSKARYEAKFRAVRVRRDVAEKLEEVCKGRSMPDCVSEILERALAGGQQADIAPMLPVDCRAVRLAPFNVYQVDCGGKKAVTPNLADFARKLGVSIEVVEGELPAPKAPKAKARRGGG